MRSEGSAAAQAVLTRAAGVLRGLTHLTASGSTNWPSSGPIFVLKLEFTPEEFGRRLVGELWLYPDGSRIMELSTKCPPAEAFQVAAEARAFLAGKGVDIIGEQQTKTKTALEFFSQELEPGEAG